MFAIIRTRWQTRPLSCRAKRRSSAAPGSLRKKYAGILHPPNIVRLPINSTTSGGHRKPVLINNALRIRDTSSHETNDITDLDPERLTPRARPFTQGLSINPVSATNFEWCYPFSIEAE